MNRILCTHCGHRIYGLAQPGAYGSGWAHVATRRERCEGLRSTVAVPAPTKRSLDRSPRARRARAS